MSADRIAAVLGEHQFRSTFLNCTCGKWKHTTGSSEMRLSFATHQAEMLAPVLRELQDDGYAVAEKMAHRCHSFLRELKHRRDQAGQRISRIDGLSGPYYMELSIAERSALSELDDLIRQYDRDVLS